MKDYKYLAAYSIPLSAVLSISFLGYWTYFTVFFAFVIIPVLELILPERSEIYNDFQKSSRLKNKFFDWLLYLNIVVVFGVLSFALYTLTVFELETYEYVGLVFSTGIVLGVNGINVGHELGHRLNTKEKYLGKLLLLPSLYMHFFIEHNFGHHLNVATKDDPATAKYNQNLYSFWFTSTIGQYFKAWRIQKKLIKQNGKKFFSIHNDMLWYLIIQGIYLYIVFLVFEFQGVVFALLSAMVGFLLLETVNYIEHYGLMREKLDSGRYERVKKIHSWNSNHIIGRIVLYELTRHSDHHYKSNKKYQILECHEESPQMPYGYPTSMVLALIPPLWFKIMNKRVPEKMISLQ